MTVKGNISADFARAVAIEEERARKKSDMIFVTGVLIFVISCAVAVAGMMYAISNIVEENRVAVPSGCAMVDNLSSCHTVSTPVYFPLKIWHTETRTVCDKDMVCRDGRVYAWKRGE